MSIDNERMQHVIARMNKLDVEEMNAEATATNAAREERNKSQQIHDGGWETVGKSHPKNKASVNSENNDNNNNSSSKKNDNNGWETIAKTNNHRNNRNRTSNKNNNNNNSNVDDDNNNYPYLASISYIPPTLENSQFQQFMVLLVGIPGSGKTTFAKSLQKAMPYRFMRISQDDLPASNRSRHRCEVMTKAVFSKNSKCPIIDRCNFNAKQRSNFINLSLSSDNQNSTIIYPVDCVVFDIPVKECIRRCKNRRNHPTIKPHKAESVVQMMASQYDPPARQKSAAARQQQQRPNSSNNNNRKKNIENFRSVYHIYDNDTFTAVLIELLNKI